MLISVSHMFPTGISTWVLFALSFFLASLSLWAAITAKSCLKEQRRLLESNSIRSLRQLDSEVADLSVALSANVTTVRRLSSRIGMQDLRARTNGALNIPENATPQERKALLKRGLADGTLRALPP